MEPEVLDFLEFGPYRIDREQRLLIKGNTITTLAPKVFDLLLALAESAGRIVEKESLLKKLWPGTFVEEGSLTRNISTLRKALGESPDGRKYIETIPKRGYRFEAGVSAGAASSERRQQLIAVEPLENVSGDKSQNYFAEILTEALITELAQIRKLKVVSAPVVKNSVQLDMLVGGSVMRMGSRVQITVAVVHAKTRSQLWSQRYDRDLGEILTVQKEAACAIAAEVRAELTPREQKHFRAAPLVSPEAYDCYLRGRFYAQRQNKDDNDTAMLALERAVAIDPAFASAYAELAQTYIWKLFLFAPHERQWEEKAFVAVEKALALQPDLAVAHLARGRLLWTPANHFPHAKVVREYRQALALNPSLDEARNQLALIYCHVGYFEDALRESREAALTNPNNNLAVYRTAQTLAFQGKHEQALSILRTIPRDVNPALIGYQTAWVLFNLKRHEEASALIDQLLSDYPKDDGALYVSLQAVLAASAGNEREAERKIELTIDNGRGFGHFHHAAYHIATAFALMNRVEHAVKWLDFAAMDGFPCYPLFESDPNLENLRQDAGFIQFMAALRQQWIDFQRP